MSIALLSLIPLVAGYLLDTLLGDPEHWPHPIRLFGNLIAFGESRLNTGSFRLLKGALLALVLCAGSYFFFWACSGFLLQKSSAVYLVFSSIFVFYGLANKGLIDEGRKVFTVLNAEGIEKGRLQLARIVGRDTATLTHRQIRIAVLETMSENLSDGVVAPLFYYALAGVPGLMTYKMINTLDSMVGYRSARYELFGKFSARLDDLANFIPSRLTACIMGVVSLNTRAFTFIARYGNKHKSPNSGYPEAALAGILDTRFGGPHFYKGILVQKPFIGLNAREIEHTEINRASSVNQKTCFMMVVLVAVFIWEVYA